MAFWLVHEAKKNIGLRKVNHRWRPKNETNIGIYKFIFLKNLIKKEQSTIYSNKKLHGEIFLTQDVCWKMAKTLKYCSVIYIGG